MANKWNIANYVQRKRSRLKEECRTPNGRFGASGGVGSYDTEQVTSLFALVPTFVIPPPVATSRWDVMCHPRQCVEHKKKRIWKIEMKRGN